MIRGAAIATGILAGLGALAGPLALLPGLAREQTVWRLVLSESPAPSDHLEITGSIAGSGDATLVLRIDDSTSVGYGSRVNIERRFATGKFRWKVGLGGLATPSGRSIDLDRLAAVMVFKAAGEAVAKVDAISLQRARPLPNGARGFALGARDAPLPEGFERIAPGDSRIEAGSVTPVRRPMPDPLVANGLKGLQRLRLTSQVGRAQVTVWAEDPGEWELLPHPLSRRIQINGVTALFEHREPLAWIQERYLRGARDEHDETSTAWRAYGQHRGMAHTVEVDVGADGIEIVLEGDEPQARHLSAVMIASPGDPLPLARVLSDRARWYDETWPVLGREVAAEEAGVPKVELTADGHLAQPRPLHVRIAPGSGSRVRVTVDGLSPSRPGVVRLALPTFDGGRWKTFVWTARQRLERRRAQDSFLTLTDTLLSGDVGWLRAPASGKRHFEAWIDVPASVPPGLHEGHFEIETGGTLERIVLALEVLPVRLPPVPKPVGPYLDESPHLTWFASHQAQRMRQVRCDLDLVVALGLRGAAPAVASPTAESHASTLADVRGAVAAGLSGPSLLYAPAKRILEKLGTDRGAKHIADVDRLIVAAGLSTPVWSLADEPSNPDGHQPWQDWVAAVRALPQPRPRTAGHLNARGDLLYASRFDVVLVNGGYGLDVETIAATAASGPEVWLYNAEAPRLAAGGWLWHTAARRYQHWHARMPTADPYDPLDGRQGDVQLILPSSASCPATPSIHRDLLELADGVVDQRWLAWLDGRKEPQARALAGTIRSRLGARWTAASRLTSADLQSIRESIMDVASRLEGQR